MITLFNSDQLSYLLSIIIIIFTTSCKTLKKDIENGNYDTAIGKCLTKLEKNKKKDKLKLTLEEIFKKAVVRDQQTIENFGETKSDNYRTDYKLKVYKGLELRQEKIKKLLPLYISSQKRIAAFDFVDYKAIITSITEEFAGDLYASATNFLKNKDKASTRKAYGLLTKLVEIKKDHSDAFVLLKKALIDGQNHILLEAKRLKTIYLPKNFNSKLTDIELQHQDAKWLVFHEKQQSGRTYDYLIELLIDKAYVSDGNDIKTNSKTESLEIKDGWEYDKDDEGNIKTDSLGNKIKIDKMITVECTVIEKKQTKNSKIDGTIHVFKKSSKEVIKKIPIEGEGVFENEYAYFTGDKRALSSESQDKVKKEEKNFPSADDMLYKAIRSMNYKFETTIGNNMNILLE